MQKTLTALIIDNQLFPKIVLGSLVEEHFQTTPFLSISREAGVALYKEKQASIDIVFLNLLLHDMYKFEAIQELLAINPNVYIVGTGFSEYEFILAKILGAKDFLNKPYESANFLDVVSRFQQEKRYDS